MGSLRVSILCSLFLFLLAATSVEARAGLTGPSKGDKINGNKKGEGSQLESRRIGWNQAGSTAQLDTCIGPASIPALGLQPVAACACPNSHHQPPPLRTLTHTRRALHDQTLV